MKKGILLLVFFHSYAMELQKEKIQPSMITIDLGDPKNQANSNDQKRMSGAYTLDLEEIDSRQENEDLTNEALICCFGPDHKLHCFKKHLAKQIEQLQNSPHENAQTTLNSLRQVSTVRKGNGISRSDGNTSTNPSKVTRAPNNPTIAATNPAATNNPTSTLTNVVSDVSNVTGDVQKLVHDAIAAYNSTQTKQKYSFAGLAGGAATIAVGLLTAYLNCKK